MTDPAQTAASTNGVHRLIDMVVEEVSLVDRAANKHRFLIVKRNDAMDDETTPTETVTTNSESCSDPTPKEAALSLADGSPLGAAVAALESLTAIVELLGSLGADRSDTRLAALAQQLRATAEQILERTGFGAADASSESADDGDASEETDAANEPDDSAGSESAEVTANAKADSAPGSSAAPSVFANDVAAAKQTLARLVEIAASALPRATEKRASLPQKAEAATSGAHSCPGVSGTESGPPVSESLAKLAESFRALSETVKEQQQRLGRVEKQFGLPNSTAHAERVTRATEEIGWPLDLNHPMDRESVDKAISFHDP